MPSLAAFLVFLSAAAILAITPGPGIFYVLTRSLKGGRREGYASAIGTTLGGFFHVVAAALGLSALLAASALAFSLVKYTGAAYLVYLGVKTMLGRQQLDLTLETGSPQQLSSALRQGVTVEILNPKTALFFLAFIPQFINPAGPVFWQFVLLGSLSVTLNTLVDIIVVSLAGPLGQALLKRPRLQRLQRLATGGGLITLGGYVALTGD